MMRILNLYFIGKLGNAAMTAGVGLAISFTIALVQWVLVGANCAQETLTSQAFGAGEIRRCGILLNRGRVILTVIFIPICVLFLESERILLFIGLDDEVSKYAGQYLISMIAGTFFEAQFDLNKRWLIQMQVTWVPMIA